MKSRRLLRIAVFLPSLAFADGTHSYYLENDAFSGQDRNYSNGLRYSWVSDPSGATELSSLDGLVGYMKSIGLAKSPEAKSQYGISLTQLMYTPDHKDSFVQPEGERRYAGWLGLGFSLHVKDDHLLNSAEFIVGTTGANSLAEATQDFVHSIADGGKFNGWDDQVPNEITVDLSFVQKRRTDFQSLDCGDFGVDGTLEWGARLGTFRTAAHLGASLRGGLNLRPSFADLRISETAYGLDSEQAASDWSPYFLLGGTIRGIAYDATLDGPVFNDFETGNHRQGFVAEVFAGIGLRYRQIELSYVHTWRTEEYEEQNGLSDFGALAFRFQF